MKQTQYAIRTHIHSAGLDWKRDFRRQDPEKLSLLFRAVSHSLCSETAASSRQLTLYLRTQAAADFPILKTYANQWATAMIARRYMQNLRRHARSKGYMSRRARYNRGGEDNMNVD